VNKQNILVLGGTGFIGSALLSELKNNSSRYNVIVLVNKTRPGKGLDAFETVQGDIGSFDLSVTERFRPDVIVHMARKRGRGAAGRLIAAIGGARANRRLISYMKNSIVPPHIIYISGTLAYGDCGNREVTEELPLNPAAFARQYIRAERPFMREVGRGELPVSMLRPPWVIGGASWFKGYYLDTMRDFGYIPLFGRGENIMSFIDVEDCAGLIEHSLANALPGNNYNLFVPGAAIAQKEFTGLLSGISGLPVREFSRSVATKKYGRTVWEAFTFSLNASTIHNSFIDGYRFRYPSVRAMVEKYM
jgi:nucleoside-diphosphate-sugar epimerase